MYFNFFVEAPPPPPAFPPRSAPPLLPLLYTPHPPQPQPTLPYPPPPPSQPQEMPPRSATGPTRGSQCSPTRVWFCPLSICSLSRPAMACTHRGTCTGGGWRRATVRIVLIELKMDVADRSSPTEEPPSVRYQETVSQGKTWSGQGCQTKRSTLKPSSLASVKVPYWRIAVGQGRSPLNPSSLASR